MRRRAFLTIGLLASILGLSILADTAFAQGCCCGGGGCPMEMASCGTTACLSPARVCDGQGPTACTSGSFLYVEVNNFPSSCVPNPDNNTKCDKPLSNCSRNCVCQVNPDGSCGTVPNSLAPWQSAAKPTTNDC